MTTKERAKELVDKFMQYVYWFAGDPIVQIDNAKQCALICVDEIMQVRFMDKDVEEYWQQVKQEIESLCK